MTVASSGSQGISHLSNAATSIISNEYNKMQNKLMQQVENRLNLEQQLSQLKS